MPIDQNTEVGTVFTGAPKRLPLERLWAFSGGPYAAEGWPKKNLHTDPETAQRVGLATPIASGTQFQGHLAELLIELFGEGWLEHGWMDVRFVRGVGADETLTTELVVKEREPVDHDGVRFVFEVRCANDDGEPGLVGTAGGVLR